MYVQGEWNLLDVSQMKNTTLGLGFSIYFNLDALM